MTIRETQAGQALDAYAAALDTGHDMPGLDGLHPVSTGPAPGCDECGLGHMHEYDDDPEAYEYATEGIPFSRARCDGCRTTLAGRRYFAHGWLQTDDGEECVHLTICEDCLMEIEYPGEEH